MSLLLYIVKWILKYPTMELKLRFENGHRRCMKSALSVAYIISTVWRYYLPFLKNTTEVYTYRAFFESLEIIEPQIRQL